MGNMEGRFIYRGLQGTAKEDSGNGASLCKWAVRGEPGGRAPVLGDPEGYIKKALETGVFLHRGPVGGPGS